MASLNSSDFGSKKRSWIEEQLFVEDRTPGLEGLHELRLTVLLRDVVEQKGRMDEAKVLGVNYKTLVAALASGQLTPRLCDALERLLMIGELAALEEVRESVRGLAKQVERLELDLQGVVKELRQEIGDEIGSVEKKQALGFEKLSRRQDRMEDSQGAGTAPTLSGTDNTRAPKTQPRQEFRRTDPSVVTMEPQAGESEIYGPT